MSREAMERYCAQCSQHATCGYVKIHRTDLCVPLGYYDEGYTQAEEDYIKKASLWLDCNLSDRPIEDRKFWVEDFKNYMKGE